MSHDLKTEERILAQEHDWLLKSETDKTFHELVSILSMGYELTTTNLNEKSYLKPEKFILNGISGTRCVLTLDAYQIIEADLVINILKGSTQILAYRFKLDVQYPWVIHQLQESANYLNESFRLAESTFELSSHHSASQIINILNSLMLSIKKSRDLLVNPSKSFTSSRVSQTNVKFTPELPDDLDITIILQSPKLICTVYQLSTNQKAQTVVTNRFSMECMIPRLNDIMIIITRAINLCQMLKDKFACIHKYGPLSYLDNIDGDDDDNDDLYEGDDVRPIADVNNCGKPIPRNQIYSFKF